MSSSTSVTPNYKRGVVKQVLSGDTVVIRGYPKSGPPPEKQITFPYLLAPKLARRPVNPNDETRDEPWAWESREFLRKKLVGEEVHFTVERPPNANRDYGNILLGKEIATAENISESMVKEGLVVVRRDGAKSSPDYLRLIELEENAKANGKGKWSNSPPSDHVRKITWSLENPRKLVDLYAGNPVKAIIEHVRDGSTVRAFLLPDFYYISLMISGIRCPGFKLDDGKPDPTIKVPYADEARYYVEVRLLQRDVEIVLESVNNTNFVGSILHPNGNIAERLLEGGFAKCVEWSMAFMKSGAEKLRAAERQAKEKRMRLWEDYQTNAQIFSGKEKDFTGTAIEVYNGDAISVRTANGTVKKCFLSSIRPPREAIRITDDEVKQTTRQKTGRPLYDIPWMFEARELLRKKLISKKVHCTLDYISPARDNFPEKYSYTVTIGGQNIAEELVSKGLATVVRYRQDDDQRSSRYDDLLAAENQAIKGQKGIHSKKEIPVRRINDLTVDHSRIRHYYLPSWQRALRTDAIVEFVASGSRLRLYIPKDSCLVTFLLAGISCPRSGRPGQESEEYGEEALAFTKEKVLQRDVSIHIDTTDKAGSCVIGWLWTDNNVNLSVALVEEGLAEVHFTAEKTDYNRPLKLAEDSAKLLKKNLWSNYVEVEEKPVEEEKMDNIKERVINYESIVITEVTNDLHFFVQYSEQGGKLENLMTKLRQEFESNPPLSGAFTPKRREWCAARFSEDNQWYRAKVEKVQGGNVTILYVDYGNRETVPSTRLAMLPSSFTLDKPYANEFGLALVQLPSDKDYKDEAIKAFSEDVFNNQLLLNVEYKVNGLPFATIYDPKNNNYDIGKGLVADGLLLVDESRKKDNNLQKLLDDYRESENSAKKSHIAIWEYGDIRQDDANEFGR